MRTYNSPLRYPGSKIKLVRYIERVLEFNHFQPNVFVEPFVGGGSVFINFLLNNTSQRVIIGDKDRLIYSFWWTLFNHPQCLVHFVKNVDVSTANFKFYKEVAEDKNILDRKELAKSCLFLNRTSFSGILANTVGPIGGKYQKSQYKIDCRFNKEVLITKIKLIAGFKHRITVLPYDWSKTLIYAQKNKAKNEKLLFYFDPPFYNKADKLYRCFFESKWLHERLSQTLKQLKHTWILSYDRAKEIKELYHCFIQRSLAFPYSINSPARRIEKEYFITSKNLRKPDMSLLS